MSSGVSGQEQGWVVVNISCPRFVDQFVAEQRRKRLESGGDNLPKRGKPITTPWQCVQLRGVYFGGQGHRGRGKRGQGHNGQGKRGRAQGSGQKGAEQKRQGKMGREQGRRGTRCGAKGGRGTYIHKFQPSFEGLSEVSERVKRA